MESDAVRKRVFRTIEKYGLVKNGDKICIALSGGKDSACALFLLAKYVEEKNIECEIMALHLNLGLGESERVEDICKEQAARVGVKLESVSVRELGIDLREIAREKKRAICSVCGVVKRYLLNRLAREKGCDKLATGHNMDDFLVFFFKNLLSKNYFWISKFRPKVEGAHEKVVCRIRPLFFVGNAETELFCRENAIPYLQSPCPYSRTAVVKVRRRKWYEMLYSCERFQRNFRYNLARSVVEMSGFFERGEAKEFRECRICGEPTNREICAFCRIRLS